jgi:hypothetical protein
LAERKAARARPESWRIKDERMGETSSKKMQIGQSRTSRHGSTDRG